MYRGFLYTLPPTLAPLVSPAFVTIDKPILILYYLLKSMVYIKAQAWCYKVMGFAKCIMSCICHYSITHNFTILNIPYIQSIHSFLPTSPNHWSFTFSIVLTATLLWINTWKGLKSITFSLNKLSIIFRGQHRHYFTNC